MSKRKKYGLIPDEPVVAEPVVKKKFWNGHEVFECEFCKFDSLESNVRDQHVVLAHTQPASQEPSLIVSTDRFGNEVK